MVSAVELAAVIKIVHELTWARGSSGSCGHSSYCSNGAADWKNLASCNLRA